MVAVLGALCNAELQFATRRQKGVLSHNLEERSRLRRRLSRNWFGAIRLAEVQRACAVSRVVASRRWHSNSDDRCHARPSDGSARPSRAATPCVPCRQLYLSGSVACLRLAQQVQQRMTIAKCERIGCFFVIEAAPPRVLCAPASQTKIVYNRASPQAPSFDPPAGRGHRTGEVVDKFQGARVPPFGEVRRRCGVIEEADRPPNWSARPWLRSIVYTDRAIGGLPIADPPFMTCLARK
jgi:hypothetical protein